MNWYHMNKTSWVNLTGCFFKIPQTPSKHNNSMSVSDFYGFGFFPTKNTHTIDP